MRRLLIIAAREYMSYVRTAGFWLSLALAPMGIVLGAGLPVMLDRAEQGARIAVVDLTGRDYASRLITQFGKDAETRAIQAMRLAALATAGEEAGRRIREAGRQGGEAAARSEFQRVAPMAARSFRSPVPPLVVAPPPAGLPSERGAANAALRSFFAGERTLPDGKRLDHAVVLHPTPQGGLGVDLWSAELGANEVEDSVRAAVRDVLRAERLSAAGVSPQLLAELDELRPEIRELSPKAAGESVTLRDRLPTIVGFGLGIGLFLVIFAGAGLLLNSVMEEKSSRVLEILAGSASTAEIMGGKILGVAALTATMLVLWSALGAVALLQGAPGLAADVGSVLLGRGFLLYFVLYAALGYVLYAAMFAAIGAFCESPREAQTLLTPVVLLATVPILFMSLAVRDPGSPLLQILSWIPPFTPFLMLARAGSEVAWWEIAGTLLLMLVTAAVVVQLSGRAFRAGAISTGPVNLKGLLSRVIPGRASA
jgi:ABC-2 type transport system permease protein